MFAFRFIAAATLVVGKPLYAQDKTAGVDSILHFANNSGAAKAKVPVAKDSVAQKPAPVPAAAPKLEGLVGEYELAPGRSIVITLENGQLQGQPTNSSKRPLVYISGTTFGVGSADSQAKVTFTLDDEGRAAMMTMKQNGQDRVLMRVK